MRTILHIDMNSYFASVEQQANPRLRGKPIGVTGGDRLERTVLSTASVEAKKLGVKTGMSLWEAKKICPQLIVVCSDHEKYLSITKNFLSIFKNYTPYLEIFSIDECFLELSQSTDPLYIAQEIKQRLKNELGEKITCSVGISYNKLLAKLAGSLQKPDGLVIIPDQKIAIEVLDRVALDDVCGIGPRIKRKLFNMGIINFSNLRKVPKECLVASFKNYGKVLYNMSRGIDDTPIVPFYEKEEVKSVGHRHTTLYDTNSCEEIRGILFKICEMIADKLRNKKLIGKTIHLWFRYGFNRKTEDSRFESDGMQKSLGHFTYDGVEIFKIAWKIFLSLWDGRKIRMIGAAVSNLKPSFPQNLSLLEEDKKKEVLFEALDKVNHRFGDFTLKRGSTLGMNTVKDKPNPFLSDRRFKISCQQPREPDIISKSRV